jgi:hypothetical protein
MLVDSFGSERGPLGTRLLSCAAEWTSNLSTLHVSAENVPLICRLVGTVAYRFTRAERKRQVGRGDIEMKNGLKGRVAPALRVDTLLR